MQEFLPLSKDIVLKAIDIAPESVIAKSVRRIYFTGLQQSIKQRGYWHTDIMSGMGSGILMKYDDAFFLMTARHVLKDLLDYESNNGKFPNESPFWTDVYHKPNWRSLHDFLMPKRIWDIGSLINADEKIIVSDVVLIELFTPGPLHKPDIFLDIRDSSLFLEKAFFRRGQLLFISGYPFEKNSYDWSIEHPEFTHATTIHRQSYVGTFEEDSSVGFISFEVMDGDVTHENSNGMSGGIVYNVEEKLENIKFCGMVLTAGSNKCHFLPSYLLYNAITNYKQAPYITVDPMADEILSPEDAMVYIEEYLKIFT